VIFPNPASDKFSIDFRENADGANVEVYDLLGVLRSKSCLAPYGDRVDIDVGGLTPGIYVVKVLVGERILGTEKVTINY
jgi:hypothetical protein